MQQRYTGSQYARLDNDKNGPPDGAGFLALLALLAPARAGHDLSAPEGAKCLAKVRH